MSTHHVKSAVRRRPEALRSVLDEFSKMQSASSTRGSGLTDHTQNSPAFVLNVKQMPKDCRIAGKPDGEKRTSYRNLSDLLEADSCVAARASRWPLDPAPVVDFILEDNDPTRSYLHSPFWFCSAALEYSDVSQGTIDPASGALTGCLVSSLHKVKLQDGIEHGIFIFGDLHAKVTGTYRLRFTLYELRSNSDSAYVATLTSTLTEPFHVHTSKTWPGQAESTSLSRHLCESGIKLRIRKETSKRKAQHQDWSSDKRTAVSSLSMSTSMGPPPSRTRRMTGEEINPDQLRYSGGLGIKGAMDREQSMASQHYLRGSYAGTSDYRSPFDSLPSLSGSYLSQSNSAFDQRSANLYNPTSYAGTPYLTGQLGYGSNTPHYSDGPGLSTSAYPQRSSSMSEQPYSNSQSSGYSSTTSRSNSSYIDSTARPDVDRYYNPNTVDGICNGRSLQSDAGKRYDQSRTGPSMLLSEPTHQTGTKNSWPPATLSTHRSTTLPLE